MRVAVTGASGMIGSALVSALEGRGDEVVALVRRPPGAGEARWDPDGGVLDPAALAGVDAVVHLAAEPAAPHSIPGVIKGRWTEQRKRKIHDSREDCTGTVAQGVAAAGTPVLVCASGAHYYGSRGDEVLTETSSPGQGFLPGVVRDWEAAAEPARAIGARVVHLRTGVVQSPSGGAVKVQLPLFKLGLGGRAGSGRQWISWVHVDDTIRAYLHALDSPTLEGGVNVTAPHPVTNSEWAATLARVLHRPTLLPIPEFAPKLLLGEIADTLLFDSIRVLPEKLQADGFTFRFPYLRGALEDLLGR